MKGHVFSTLQDILAKCCSELFRSILKTYFFTILCVQQPKYGSVFFFQINVSIPLLFSYLYNDFLKQNLKKG